MAIDKYLDKAGLEHLGEVLVPEIKKKHANSYYGKNVVHMGDSWVHVYNIAEMAAERVGYSVTNCGFSASAISAYNTAVADVDKFALINLAKAIRDNDFTEQDAVAGSTWTAPLARLKAVDWSTVDVLILSYGVNDYGVQNPIGDTSARDEESVCGALKSAISIFNTINQNMEIIVTTPCYRYHDKNRAIMTTLEKKDLLEEYRNAIGLTAYDCGVKLIDMRALSGINEDNHSVTLESDGLHPTEIGKRMWADAFARSLEGGFGGAFDTSVIDIELDADNLCEDSEKFNRHNQWNATYVDTSVKYLCTSGTNQYMLAVLGQKHFDILPIGTKVSLKGYGKKIGASNHRIGFRIYDATKSSIIIEKAKSVINSTTDSPIEYSFTTEAEYTDCWVVFCVNNMTTWENGKALVRDMKCTVELPNSGYLKKVGELPTASSTYEGQTYLLTAPQTGYIEGGIYKCEEVTPSTSPKTYYWKLIGGNSMEYSQYMVDERDAVLTRLKNFYGIRNPIVIGFSTDHHSSGKGGADIERLQAVKTLRDLTKMFHFNVCVLGGDGGVKYNDSDTDYSGLQSRVVALTQALNGSFCPIFHLVGNHDGHQDFLNSLADDVFASHRTDSFKEKYVTVQDRSTNCYYDDPSCNVRFIFLISQPLVNYEKAITKQFLQNSLETIPQGYDVIIFSHHPLGSLEDTPGRVDSWNEPLGWSDVVDPYADRIIACIDGHVHCDKHEILHNILYLSTTCAGTRELNDGSTRTQGTADFTAYDVMVIDRDTRTIHCVRYGNGNDRDIVYKAAPYTNVIPTSIDSSGNIYNGIGYKLHYRLNSRGTETSDTPCGVTGYMPVNKGDVIRLKDCKLYNPTVGHRDYIAFYDSSFTCIGSHYTNQYSPSGEQDLHQIIDADNSVTQFTVPNISAFDSVAYLRISSAGIGEHSIITINEKIPVTLDPIPDDGTDIDFTNWEV